MAFKELIKKITGNTLYFPGKITQESQKKEFEDNKEVLEKLGISFITLPKEQYTGLELFHAGYKKEAEELAERNAETFRKKRIFKIITSSPEAYHTFKTMYPKWTKNWDITVEHTTQTILNALQRKKIRIEKEVKEQVSYHDPCCLGKYENEYESAREAINLLGGELKESVYSKENAMCCGAGGNVLQNFPKEAKNMAKQRISQFPKEVKKIITPAGTCFAAMHKEDDRIISFATYTLQKIRGTGL